MTMKTQQLQIYGMCKTSPKREVYSNAILPQETRKTFNRQYNFIPKTTVKEEEQQQQKAQN